MTFTDADLDKLYEESKLDDAILVGSDVRQLIAEIRHHRRQPRVDTALAQQLGRAIENNAKLHERLALIRLEIERWSESYPLGAFPEPDMKLAAAALKAADTTLDAVTASNIRHVLTRVLQLMNATTPAPDANSPATQK